MKTTQPSRNKKPLEKPEQASTVPALLLQDAVYAQVNSGDIAFSPLNYRKYFSEAALKEFAEELKGHGMISPLTVRPAEGNRYELVAGERRLRAARMAGLSTVPATIVSLTDEQVIEIQLSENLQRENPHPMQEAQAIGQMQQAGRKMEEIAARLGKSRPFVYSRLKLLSLVDAFQEMFLADAIQLQDALQIALLSPESQADFFEEHCKKWKQDKHFEIHNLGYYLNHYRYDLNRAPFNIKDKTLFPEAGSCMGCPSNSVTLKMLFPEFAKQAVCSNKECYNQKCRLHYVAELTRAIGTCQPVALIVDNRSLEFAESIISLVPAAAEIPRIDAAEITLIEKPQAPDRMDFDYDEETDEEAFKEALDDYEKELEIYTLRIEGGSYQGAILLDNGSIRPVCFSRERPRPIPGRQQAVTAKEVQAAIKAGEATPELLRAEIERLRQRETRQEELDAEKVQLTVHGMFAEMASVPEKNTALTAADMAGARLLIYQSLDYNSRCIVSESFFAHDEDRRERNAVEEIYDRLANLTEGEFSWLIRMAISGKAESKYPNQQAGFFLYQMAQEAGLPVKTIEDGQAAKREERKEKQRTRVKELENKIAKLEKE